MARCTSCEREFTPNADPYLCDACAGPSTMCERCEIEPYTTDVLGMLLCETCEEDRAISEMEARREWL